MNKTNIEWVKNPDSTQGYTWNPITGCLNHIDGMCRGGNFPCYAYKLAHGRLKGRYLANLNIALPHENPKEAFNNPFYPRFWEDRLYFDTGTGKPKGIFVCDMSDLFGIGIPEEWTRKVISQIEYHFQHRFYLLTKRPENLIKFSPYPPNCYVGVSVTNQEMFDNAIHYLKMVDAKVKFLSFEPLLDHIIVDKQH